MNGFSGVFGRPMFGTPTIPLAGLGFVGLGASSGAIDRQFVKMTRTLKNVPESVLGRASSRADFLSRKSRKAGPFEGLWELNLTRDDGAKAKYDVRLYDREDGWVSGPVRGMVGNPPIELPVGQLYLQKKGDLEAVGRFHWRLCSPTPTNPGLRSTPTKVGKVWCGREAHLGVAMTIDPTSMGPGAEPTAAWQQRAYRTQAADLLIAGHGGMDYLEGPTFTAAAALQKRWRDQQEGGTPDDGSGLPDFGEEEETGASWLLPAAGLGALLLVGAAFWARRKKK